MYSSIVLSTDVFNKTNINTPFACSGTDCSNPLLIDPLTFYYLLFAENYGPTVLMNFVRKATYTKLQSDIALYNVSPPETSPLIRCLVES